VAINCFCSPTVNVTAVGERLTTMSGTIVTVAVLDFVASAAEVTVTKTCAGFGIAAGAK
jgi:hypothetical protein